MVIFSMTYPVFKLMTRHGGIPSYVVGRVSMRHVHDNVAVDQSPVGGILPQITREFAISTWRRKCESHLTTSLISHTSFALHCIARKPPPMRRYTYRYDNLNKCNGICLCIHTFDHVTNEVI